MLNSIKQKGVSLIELIITVALLALLAGLATPTITQWLVNSRIRTATDSFQSGLQLARAEATKRNTQVAFTLTNSAPIEANVNTIAGDSAGDNWTVRVYQSSGTYGATDYIGGAQAAPDNSTATIALTAFAGATSLGGVDTVVFNSLGQVSGVFNGATAVGGATRLDAAFNDSAVACQHASTAGPARCLKIQIGAGGGARTCDPHVSTSSDPRYCTS